jgi:WS/DGAT/MGAT family acyltransferase
VTRLPDHRPFYDHRGSRIRTTQPRQATGTARTAIRIPNPFSLLRQARRPVDAVLAGLGEAGRAAEIALSKARASMRTGGPAGLCASSSGSRHLATAALDADDIRRIRKVASGTSNDVLLAVVSGMLRTWLHERGKDVDAAPPRALIPVAQRAPRTGATAGNRLSGYLTELPVDVPEPLARLRAMHTAMDVRKAAGPQRGAGAITLLADYLPPVVSRLSGPLAGHTARFLFDILVTNVPIPDIPLTVGGCRLLEVYPLPPLARGQALAVGLSSYCGRVHLGLVADGHAGPDLDRLAAAAHEELAALQKACAEL